MLSRSHAAHAASTNWLDDMRTAWRTLARFAGRAWRNAVMHRGAVGVDGHMHGDVATTRAGADRFAWDGPRRRQPQRDAGASMWQQASAMWRLRRSRLRIAALNSEMLKDIGVSFAEAEAEANKPFWRG